MTVTFSVPARSGSSEYLGTSETGCQVYSVGLVGRVCLRHEQLVQVRFLAHLRRSEHRQGFLADKHEYENEGQDRDERASFDQNRRDPIGEYAARAGMRARRPGHYFFASG